MTQDNGASERGLSDRGVTTLGILKVNHDHNRSFLGNYLPFVYHCLAAAKAEVVSAPELQDALQAEFAIRLPQAVLGRLLHHARDEGKVKLERGVYTVEHTALEGCGLDATRAAVQRGYRQLVDAVAAFARVSHGVLWSDADADHLIAAYIDSFSSSVLAAALTGKSLPPPDEPPSREQFIVHRFVAHILEREQQLFEFLATAVKGRMLSDALFYEVEGREPSEGLEGLEVYFDGPMLLHVMGYAGTEVQAPLVELVELLKRQGAILRCFTHNLTEAQEILDVAASRVWAGRTQERFFGDVVAYLVRSGRTRSDVELMSERLERDLLRRGIQTVETPDRNPALQPDEERLEKMLQRQIPYRNPRALLRDVDSLTAVHRLRNGRAQRDLAKSGAVFVTRNYDLFRVSARFLDSRRHGRAVPHCVHHIAFTVLIWLHEPLAAPDLPRERIIADAYAALNPDDRLWDAYNSEIDRLRAEGTLDDDDVRYLRFADEAKDALMDVTMGDHEAFVEGTVAQVLARSREVAQAALREELESERNSGERTRERVAKVSRMLARWVSVSVFVLLIATLACGAVFGPVGPVHEIVPTIVQIPCAVFAIACGMWTVIRPGTLSDLRATLRGRLAQLIESALLWFLDARPDKGSTHRGQ